MLCASITVTYNPDASILISQIESLPSYWTKVIVDNGSTPDLWQPVSEYIGSRSDIKLLIMATNIGLSAAQNEGLRWLSCNTSFTHVLLLDQDSEPEDGAALMLADAWRKLEEAHFRVGAVGPLLVDPSSGLNHKFHVINGPFWSRTDGRGRNIVRCAGLNGSGTFMKLSLAVELGGMDESLFIDLIDAEWSFRLTAQGMGLYGVPKSIFKHRMGEKTKHVWLIGWRAWPVRSPLRHRYLFRNYTLLLRRRYVPAVWKVWAIAKIILTALLTCITGPERLLQLRNMARGLLDGASGQTGKIP